MDTYKPHILITNDDGIHAKGIAHLAASLKDHFSITVVAPLKEQSGKGVGITINQPLTLKKEIFLDGVDAFSVSGTPADCVRLGVRVVLRKAPALIVSGINRGSNHGRTVLYSGTVGGVIEGALRGIPGIAFSTYNFEEPDYISYAPFIPKIISFVLDHPLPDGTILNVNFPHIEQGKQLKGLKMNRQGRRYWREDLEEVSRDSLEGSYTFSTSISDCKEADLSDSIALEEGWITAVPVHIDELTDWRYIKAKKETFEKLFSTVFSEMSLT